MQKVTCKNYSSKTFRYFHFLSILAILFSLLSIQGLSKDTSISPDQDMSYESNKKKYNSVEDIDKKINELEEMKRGYEAKALKNANQAQRLQFMPGELQTAKRYWKLAEDNKRIAIKIQKQIDELKVEKMKLQKKKG